jgi:hypothetical protein
MVGDIGAASSYSDARALDEWTDVSSVSSVITPGGNVSDLVGSYTGIRKDMSGNQLRVAERKATLFRQDVTQQTLGLIFGPITAILQVKLENMETQVAMAEKFTVWLASKPECSDKASLDKYVQEGQDIQQSMSETEVWNSFSTKSNPDEWRRAADYSENMVSSIAGAFNYYFVCRAGGSQYPCWTMINSKFWTTLHPDPIADKQRWYCKVCRAKYKTRFGVLIELVQDGSAKYIMAEFPPDSMVDARGMAIEEKYKHVKSPADLLAAVPNLIPRYELVLDKRGDGIYKITAPDVLLACGTFKWDQMFNLKPTKAELKAIKAKNNIEWNQLQSQKIATIVEVADAEEQEC